MNSEKEFKQPAQHRVVRARVHNDLLTMGGRGRGAGEKRERSSKEWGMQLVMEQEEGGEVELEVAVGEVEDSIGPREAQQELLRHCRHQLYYEFMGVGVLATVS